MNQEKKKIINVSFTNNKWMLLLNIIQIINITKAKQNSLIMELKNFFL